MVGPRAKTRVLFLLGCALVLAAAVARAQAASEYTVKAAFLYHFGKYVEWPKGAFKDDKAPFVIGVLGEDPFGHTLDDQVEGKTVDGRRVVVKRYTRAQDARGAQILFITASEEPRLPQTLHALAGAPVMTVGDLDRFAENGGVAGFFIDDSKVHFTINVTMAAHADLKISSQLLKLARIVN